MKTAMFEQTWDGLEENPRELVTKAMEECFPTLCEFVPFQLHLSIDEEEISVWTEESVYLIDHLMFRITFDAFLSMVLEKIDYHKEGD